MERFSYVARDEKGKVVKGVVSAKDDTDVANKISQQGYFLVKLKKYQEKGTTGKIAPIKEKDLLVFTMHLATLIEAGIPLVEGLKDLARDAESDCLQKVISDVCFRVESGSSLKEALAIHPKSFPPLYLALIGAGELTGKLAFSLNSLADFLEWQSDLKAKVKEAATYPLILATLLVAVVALLVIKVVPTFEPMFAETGAELPLTTKVILELSRVSIIGWPWFLGGAIGLVFIYITANKNPKGKYIIDSAKLKIPIFGSLIHKIVLSRFCHVLALAIQSGVSVLGAIEIATQSMGNFRLEQAAMKARDAINLGEKISSSLDVSKDFPPLVVRMIGVGEETGTLAQSLNKVSGFYDKEIPRAVKKIFALFEPMMIIAMGMVVGFIAMGVLMPMFTLVNSID